MTTYLFEVIGNIEISWNHAHNLLAFYHKKFTDKTGATHFLGSQPRTRELFRKLPDKRFLPLVDTESPQNKLSHFTYRVHLTLHFRMLYTRISGWILLSNEPLLPGKSNPHYVLILYICHQTVVACRLPWTRSKVFSFTNLNLSKYPKIWLD